MIPDHDHYGNAIRLQKRGKEVRLIFVAASSEKAGELYDSLRHQLKTGVLFLSLTGEATPDDAKD